MKYLTDQAGVASEFYIDSAATSREEIGNGVHHGTRQKLKEVTTISVLLYNYCLLITFINKKSV